MSIATLCGRKATPLPAPCFSAAILGRFEAHTLHRESVMWIVFGIGNEPPVYRIVPAGPVTVPTGSLWGWRNRSFRIGSPNGKAPI